MSNVKERILGAVTVMSDQDAEKLWELIRVMFTLSNLEEVEPEEDEIAIMKSRQEGCPDYQPCISQEELWKELGL